MPFFPFYVRVSLLQLNSRKKGTLVITGLLGTSIPASISWVAVKELKLSYYIGEAPLFTIYTQYGNLIQVP